MRKIFLAYYEDKTPPPWGFYRRYEGGKLVACNIQLQFPLDLQERCPWLFEISTPFINPNDAGVGEKLTGDEIEDRRIVSRNDQLGYAIQDVVEGVLDGLMAARRAQSGVCTFYCYLPTLDCKEKLRSIKVPEGVDCQVRIREDPKWQEYWEWLFPHRTMDRMQVFNWELVNALKEAGEDLGTPHDVIHLLYLPQGGPYDSFCDWARNNAFTLITDTPPEVMPTKAGQLPLVLVRSEPNVTFLELNDAMFVVILETEKLEGTYFDCRIMPNVDFEIHPI